MFPCQVSRLILCLATFMKTFITGANGQAYLLAHPNPPRYYISPPLRGQLYQLVNDSYAFQVHVQNATQANKEGGDVHPAPFPYRIVFVTKQDDTVTTGHWTWTGTQLRWNHGTLHNYGLYYDCSIDGTGARGLFMDLKW